MYDYIALHRLLIVPLCLYTLLAFIALALAGYEGLYHTEADTPHVRSKMAVGHEDLLSEIHMRMCNGMIEVAGVHSQLNPSVP